MLPNCLRCAPAFKNDSANVKFFKKKKQFAVWFLYDLSGRTFPQSLLLVLFNHLLVFFVFSQIYGES